MLRISRSVSAVVRGSIGGRDDLIPGQECNKRQRSIKLSSTEGAAAAQRRGLRCYAGLERAMQRQQETIKAYVGPARAAQGLRHPVWGYAGLS